MKMGKRTTSLIFIAGIALLLFVTFKSGIFNTEKNDDFKECIDQKEKETQELEESDLIPLIGQYGQIKATDKKTAASTQPKIFIIVTRTDTDGKVEDWKYSTAYFELPKELRATKAAEMNVLVQLTSYYKQTGTYSGNKPAYTNYLQIRVLDTTSKGLIAEKTLIDSPQFSIPASDSSGRGYVGDEDAVEFILEACGQQSLNK